MWNYVSGVVMVGLMVWCILLLMRFFEYIRVGVWLGGSFIVYMMEYWFFRFGES